MSVYSSRSAVPTHILFIDSLSRSHPDFDTIATLPGYRETRWTYKRTFIEFNTVAEAREALSILREKFHLPAGFARSTKSHSNKRTEESVKIRHPSSFSPEGDDDGRGNGDSGGQRSFRSTYSSGPTKNNTRDNRYDDERDNDLDAPSHRHGGDNKYGRDYYDRDYDRDYDRHSDSLPPSSSVASSSYHNHSYHRDRRYEETVARYPNDDPSSAHSSASIAGYSSRNSSRVPSTTYDDIITPAKFPSSVDEHTTTMNPHVRSVPPDTSRNAKEPMIDVPPGASRILHVRNIPWDTTERELAHIFRPYLGYLDIHYPIPYDGRRRTSRPRGPNGAYCFVEFATAEAANHARLSLQGYVMDRKKEDSPVITIAFSHSTVSKRMVSAELNPGNADDRHSHDYLPPSREPDDYEAERNHYYPVPDNVSPEYRHEIDEYGNTFYQQHPTHHSSSSSSSSYNDYGNNDPRTEDYGPPPSIEGYYPPPNSSPPLSTIDLHLRSVSPSMVPVTDPMLIQVLQILSQTDPQRLIHTLTNLTTVTGDYNSNQRSDNRSSVSATDTRVMDARSAPDEVVIQRDPRLPEKIQQVVAGSSIVTGQENLSADEAYSKE